MPTSRDDSQLTTANALSGTVSGQVVQAGSIGELHFQRRSGDPDGAGATPRNAGLVRQPRSRAT